MSRLPHLGWSSHVYPLEAGDLAARPDYEGAPIPEAALPSDAVLLYIRPDGQDVLLRGRAEVAAAAASSPRAVVSVRVVFKPAIAKWNLPATLVRVLRTRSHCHGTAIYHISARAVRQMGLERAVRTVEHPQKRRGEDRGAAMRRLWESLRTNGYDDARPITIMLCRTGGLQDSLRQGHHRVSACLACGIDRMAVQFSFAGALPFVLARSRRRRDLTEGVARAFGLRIVSLARVAVRSHMPNYRATCADGRTVLVKLAPSRIRLAPVAHPLVPRPFVPKRELKVAGRRVYVLDWKPGRTKTLDALSDGELGSLVAAHASFCAAAGEGVIHGDFNCNNVLFDRGAVSGILDLEEVRAGRPCEDFVRYALTSIAHLPAWALGRRRRLVAHFARLVAETGFTPEDWRAALDAFVARRRRHLLRDGRLSPVARVKLGWCAVSTRRLAACIPKEETE